MKSFIVVVAANWTRVYLKRLITQVNVTFEELLRGSQSFGGFLEDNGFVAVPSPMNPGRNGNKYFR